MKNRLFIMMVAILLSITLIMTAAFVLWKYMETGSSSSANQANSQKANAKQPTATEIKDNTVIVKDILTNLSGNDKFIKISFAFELDSKKAKTEFETLDFIAKSNIISTLADTKSDQVQGSKGQAQLISVLMNKINPYMKEGKLKQIYITDMVLQ